MKQNMKASVLLILGAVGIFGFGCASNKVDTTNVPMSPAPTAVTEAPATPEPTAVETQAAQFINYWVKKGDCLWNIAGQPGVYGDPFMWPLIFKTNRDRIQDPDLIYPGQKLAIDKNVSAEEKQKAKKLADETPKYVPHDKPRKLSLDYF